MRVRRGEDRAARATAGDRSRGRGRSREVWAVGAISAASAAGGALAGCHPTGTAALDVAYPAGLALALAVAGSRASRGALLWCAVAAAALSRGWVYVPGLLALAVAAVHITRRRDAVLGALTGALVAQTALRWPGVGFFGLTALAAGAVSVVLLASAWRTLGRRGRLVGALVPAAVVLVGGAFSAAFAAGALAARTAVDSGTGLARSALDGISTGGLASASGRLATASADLATASSRLHHWWEEPAGLVPGVAQQRRAVLRLTDSARALTSSAARQASSIDLHRLRYTGGSIDLAEVRRIATGAGALDRQVHATESVVTQVSSPWLVAPLRTRLAALGTDLARAQRTTDLASQGAAALPGLLGGDGVRHYLVAFMTPAESRGLDGFIGAYAEIRADQGRLTIVRSGRPADLVAAPGHPPVQLTGPPDFVYRYGSFEPQDNLEDVTLSPDFPTVERVLSELYPQTVGSDHIDGVLALDPYALADLLTFTGPITVPGFPQPLDSSDAARILLRDQYLAAGNSNQAEQARHDVLQGALVAGFHRLTSGSLPDPASLSRVLDPDVRAGRLLFWTDQPTARPFLSAVGLEGAFPQPPPGQGVLAVTVSNTDNNKLDAYLHETLHDTVSYDPASGHVTEKVHVVLANTAPPTGLPAYVEGSYARSGIPYGTDRLWLSVYSRLGLAGATLDGRPFPLGQPLPEAGAEAWSGFVSVPAAASVSLDVTFAGTGSRGAAYRESVRLQPLANPVDARIRLVLPPGWTPPPPRVLGPSAVQHLAWFLSKS